MEPFYYTKMTKQQQAAYHVIMTPCGQLYFSAMDVLNLPGDNAIRKDAYILIFCNIASLNLYRSSHGREIGQSQGAMRLFAAY